MDTEKTNEMLKEAPTVKNEKVYNDKESRIGVELSEHEQTLLKQQDVTAYIDVFYVVSHSTEDDWEQISNSFDDYNKAVIYRDSDFCKNRYPNAFIVSTLKEKQ